MPLDPVLVADTQSWLRKASLDPEEPSLEEAQEALQIRREAHKVMLGRLPQQIKAFLRT